MSTTILILVGLKNIPDKFRGFSCDRSKVLEPDPVPPPAPFIPLSIWSTRFWKGLLCKCNTKCHKTKFCKKYFPLNVYFTKNQRHHNMQHIFTFDSAVKEAGILFTAPLILLMIVEFFIEAPISSHFEDLVSLVSFCSSSFFYDKP